LPAHRRGEGVRLKMKPVNSRPLWSVSAHSRSRHTGGSGTDRRLEAQWSCYRLITDRRHPPILLNLSPPPPPPPLSQRCATPACTDPCPTAPLRVPSPSLPLPVAKGPGNAGSDSVFGAYTRVCVCVCVCIHIYIIGREIWVGGGTTCDEEEEGGGDGGWRIVFCFLMVGGNRHRSAISE